MSVFFLLMKDELYYITDPEGQKKLRDLFISMGGKAEDWDRKYKQRKPQYESLDEIKHIMSQRPHYGWKKPG